MSERKEELKLILSVRARGGDVYCARIAAGGDAFLVQTQGNDPAFIRESTREVEAVFLGHGRRVTSIDEHPRGAYIATGSFDHMVRVFELAGALVWAREHENFVRCVRFSHDGELLASCSDDRSIRLFTAANGAMVRQLHGHTGWVLAVTFSPDGGTLLSGGGDPTARVWCVATGETRRQLEGHTDCISTLAYSLDWQWVATGSGDKTVRLWSTESWEAARTLQCGSRVSGALFTPDSLQLVVETSDDIAVWDVATGQKRLTVASGTGQYSWGSCLSMTLLGDRLVASTGRWRTVRMFDSKLLVDLPKVSPWAVARTPPAGFRFVASADLACLSAGTKACLPPAVLARLPREAREGLAHGVTRESVDVLGLVRQQWLPRMPLGVLHRLPSMDRDVCIAFVGVIPPPRARRVNDDVQPQVEPHAASDFGVHPVPNAVMPPKAKRARRR